MKEKNQQDSSREQNENKINKDRNPISNSEFLQTNQQHHDPAADRVAKSSRKGAGQQQDSSGGPVNS